MLILSRLGPALLLALLLPACATLTTGTNQSITVTTDPAGAVCHLRRDGTIVGVVNPTPGTVQISKSSRELRISCNRPGHDEGVATVAAEFQGMTLGNILFGGLVGVVIDASSGAAATYPTNVAVSLPPGTPAIPDERQQLSERIEALRSSCGPGDRGRCNTEIRLLERQLARLGAPTS